MPAFDTPSEEEPIPPVEEVPEPVEELPLAEDQIAEQLEPQQTNFGLGTYLGLVQLEKRKFGALSAGEKFLALRGQVPVHIFLLDDGRFVAGAEPELAGVRIATPIQIRATDPETALNALYEQLMHLANAFHKFLPGELSDEGRKIKQYVYYAVQGVKPGVIE